MKSALLFGRLYDEIIFMDVRKGGLQDGMEKCVEGIAAKGWLFDCCRDSVDIGSFSLAAVVCLGGYPYGIR